MNDYYFYVNLCGGGADGTYCVKANDYSEAYGKAMDEIGEKLYNTFPNLSIEYNIEPVYDYDED